MIKRIFAVFNYGKVISKNLINFFYFCLGVLLLMPISTIAVIATCCLGALRIDNNVIIALTFGNTFCVLLFVVILLALKHHKELHRNIILWSEDAQKSLAFINLMNKNYLNFKPNQVQISFDINGKTYSKISERGGILYSYNKILFKFDGQMVPILYSPKYDQVMILKDN